MCQPTSYTNTDHFTNIYSSHTVSRHMYTVRTVVRLFRSRTNTINRISCCCLTWRCFWLWLHMCAKGEKNDCDSHAHAARSGNCMYRADWNSRRRRKKTMNMKFPVYFYFQLFAILAPFCLRFFLSFYLNGLLLFVLLLSSLRQSKCLYCTNCDAKSKI